MIPEPRINRILCERGGIGTALCDRTSHVRRAVDVVKNRPLPFDTAHRRRPARARLQHAEIRLVSGMKRVELADGELHGISIVEGRRDWRASVEENCSRAGT